MKNIDIIVMGKTGAGKSTLVNAVLEEDLAPTGMGQAVTRENAVYTKKMMLSVRRSEIGSYEMIGCKLNMYDTVGLEIDSNITDKTLGEISKHIEEIKERTGSDDIHLVWFCVSNRSSRFEAYELELIRKLSIDYEIPFIIVLTQCFSDEEGKLEEQIRKNIPEISRSRVLAKEYSTRGGKIPAYGVSELIKTSVNDYKMHKVDILEKKLLALDGEKILRIKTIEQEGNECIHQYKESATKVSIVPAGCIPIVHGMCVKMITDLNGIAGFSSGKDFATEIFSDFIIGVVATPIMMIPLLSIAAATAYIEAVGESYLKAMLNVIDKSTDKELQDKLLMKERLKEELTNLKK